MALTMRSDSRSSVSYRPRLDAICSTLMGQPIENRWQAELESRLDEYRNLWSRIGPDLLAQAEKISGLRSPRSANVRLTLCNLPSQSILGITVNMRFAMQSFTDTPVPLRYKVDTQFHELLHRMLDGHLPRQSRSLVEHSDASRCVKNHLHLLALQKASLLELKQLEALADVVRIDSLLPGGCYREAWEIVNGSEFEYLTFLSEITE